MTIREPASVELALGVPPSESVDARPATSVLLGQSIAGAVWTLVSRLSGLVRIIVVGAVLGATYLGNTYQGINALPNLVYYQLLAGSLFASLLVPPLVRHLRQGDAVRAQALVRGFFGAMVALSACAMLLLIVLGPLVLRAFSAGVSDPATATAQRHVGLLLLILFAPQVVLYAVAGTGSAVMNAHGRFALAAGAPTLENLGMIVTVLAAGLAFGGIHTIADVSTPEIVLLGAGTTAAVGLHSAAQWLGARAAGVTMLPAAGWRDPEIRAVLRRIASALGYTGLATLQILVAFVLANRVAGGLVGFQVALNFFYLPIAVITWPVVRALTPRLAVLHQRRDPEGFHDELSRAVALASFVTLPVAVAYGLGAPEIARIVAFGHLHTGDGPTYISLSLLALAPAVVGETWFTLGNYAFYAQENVRAPLVAMAVRAAAALVVMVGAWLAHGSSVLLLIGSAFSFGSLLGAAFVRRQVRAALPPGSYALGRSLLRTLVGCAAMAAGSVVLWTLLDPLAGSRAAEVARLAVSAVGGAAAFLAVESRLHAPEVAQVGATVRGYIHRLRGGLV